MKTTIAVLLAATVLSAPAFAQTTTPAPAATPTTTPAAVTTPTQATASEAWRASKLVGVDVYNEQNESIGEISEVILDRTGKVKGFVVGVGGFLGMGVHDVLLAFDQVKFINEPRVAPAAAARPATTTGAAPVAGGPTAGAPSGAAPATATRPMNNRPAAATSTRSNDERWFPDHAIVSATKDQLKSMQQFKYN